MNKVTLLLTTIGKESNGYTTYKVAGNEHAVICEDFLRKFKASEYVKAEGGLNKGCCANESVLYWKAEFTIEITSPIDDKQELEKKLSDCLLELQKNDNGGWYE